MKYYTGIGSRETPEDIQRLMSKLAFKLTYQKYILRSGGAEGADLAFKTGAKLSSVLQHSTDIYLPWKGFNKNDSQLCIITKEAYEMAETIHPAWNKLSKGGKRLHARNCYQVLGEDLNTPSEFLICWTKNGAEIGGSRTAIVLAKKWDIPIYNLAQIGIESLWNKLNLSDEPNK